MQNVLLVANTSWYLYNFRFPLIKELKDKGYNVSIVAPHDNYTSHLQNEGIIVHDWEVSRNSINPLLEIKALIDLIRIYRHIKPDLVHHFTIKACLYGTIAAKFSRIYRVINAITGLGHVFLGTRMRNKLLRRFLKPVYKAVFMARRSTVVFQNAEDQEKLIDLGITKGGKAKIIRGSGVDINHFKPSISKSTLQRFSYPLKILFPSRLIKQKGVTEVLQACKALWDKGFEFDLLIAGDVDLGNRSSLSSKELKEIQNHPRINCLGHVEDMRKIYEKSDLVVLPSWREGLSRALIEAAAMEKPIITTDVPGCKDVVDHGSSGLLVPLRDSRSLMLSICLLMQNPELAFKFGKAARKKVLAEFEVSLVNQRTLEQYENLLKKPLLRKSQLRTP